MLPSDVSARAYSRCPSSSCTSCRGTVVNVMPVVCTNVETLSSVMLEDEQGLVSAKSDLRLVGYMTYEEVA